jgi:acyl-CoA thioesterase-1
MGVRRNQAVTRISARTPLFRSVWLLAAALILGCSSPDLEPLPADGRILAFGDSLTFGVGVAKTESYPAVLAELTGLEVINSGVSGETTDRALLRLKGELDRTRPSLLILAEGGNDILQNRNLAETKLNLAAMIELAANQSVPVVLIGIPEKKLFSSSAPLYEELAIENQLVFDGRLIASLLRTPSYKSDRVHFNEQGYRQMAESIYELLLESGAI